MKKVLLILFPVVVLFVIATLAFDSGKGNPKNREGIHELSGDSLIIKGKLLVQKMKYSEEECEAIAAYLMSDK